jgi:NAD(P)-dependent dehydrogenase (short-subunit alcohol dehydrogenase family)
MPAKLKPLAQQVIVVTGANLGIGLAVARKAAKAGAAVVLAGPNEASVRKISGEINAAGGRAHPVACDLSEPEEAAKLARAAIARFGGFDAWVNAVDSDVAVANGTAAAISHLRSRSDGGAVVNLAAASRARAHGKFAAKYARDSRADAVRLTQQRGKDPISLTLIRPSPADAPFPHPDVVAEAVLHAVRHPIRRIAVGSRGLTFNVQAKVQKHPGVAVGLGVLAVAGLAAFLGRETLGKRARPVLANALRPLILRAVAKRPVEAAKLALRHPQPAAKLARALR